MSTPGALEHLDILEYIATDFLSAWMGFPLDFDTLIPPSFLFKLE
jgi:hypothetical protein